ncbi:MAG: antitoxin Xre/MbcA/ParS toxin-binding domain-containing protein [Candidatus Cyclobacteriaceae bacterium M3_2C_046]
MDLKDLKDRSSFEKYKLIQEGVNTNMVQEFEVSYGLKKREVAFLIGVSEKTLYNIMSHNQLDKERSDRFLFIHKIFQEGEETFMTKENLHQWLNSAQVNLNRQKPIDLMDTITGAEAVFAEIVRTKHGVLS